MKTEFIDKKSAVEMGLGSIVGFALFWLTSHQKSPVNRRLPAKRYKSVHYSPHIKIERQNKHYHLHHWAIFGLLYLPLLLVRKKVRSNILHGFFIGTIIQGLTYKDRFEFVKPLIELLPEPKAEK